MKIEEWLGKVREEINRIKKSRSRDRLEYLTNILKCNRAIVSSCQGWKYWLDNPTIMNSFSEDDLKRIFEEFKVIAVMFLENDVRWTKYLQSKLELEKEEDEPSQFYI